MSLPNGVLLKLYITFVKYTRASLEVMTLTESCVFCALVPWFFAQCWSMEIFVVRTVNRVLVGKSERTFGSIIWGGGFLH